MRKTVVAMGVAATFALAGSITQPANAVPLANPSGVTAALDDLDTIDKVHCVPGWRHHYPTQWRRANGCPRYYRYYGGGPWIGFRTWGFHPRHRFHHRFHHHPRIHRRGRR
jgi:hypothetical protein